MHRSLFLPLPSVKQILSAPHPCEDGRGHWEVGGACEREKGDSSEGCVWGLGGPRSLSAPSSVRFTPISPSHLENVSAVCPSPDPTNRKYEV